MALEPEAQKELEALVSDAIRAGGYSPTRSGAFQRFAHSDVARTAFKQGRSRGYSEGKASTGDIEKARKESASQARAKAVVEERKRCLTILGAYQDQPETAARLMESGLPLDKLLKKPPTTEALAQEVLAAGEKAQPQSHGASTADRLAQAILDAGDN